MKLIKSSKIRKMIKDMWPNFKKLEEIYLQDGFYLSPKLTELEIAVKESNVAKMKNLGDCDDYALFSNAFVKKYFIDKGMNKFNGKIYTIAYGEANGTMWNGWSDAHTANIAICEEGLILVEPQTEEIWKPNSYDDRLYFIRI